MPHKCFISFKKEDERYKDKILKKLGQERIKGRALNKWIDSDNIDHIMQVIRNDYMKNTSVTIFLIGNHSSENEGLDENNNDKNAYIKRELQATLYNRKNFKRSGLLGVVLPSMESKIYKGKILCKKCGRKHNKIILNDKTVIREFSANYFLKKDLECQHSQNGNFCVLVRYCNFMDNPDKYINMAYDKLNDPISKEVHWKDLRK